MISDDRMTDRVGERRAFVTAGVTYVLATYSSRQNLGFNVLSHFLSFYFVDKTIIFRTQISSSY